MGGTAGIGRALALRLAQAKVSVNVLGRNEEAGKKIVDEMKGKKNCFLCANASAKISALNPNASHRFWKVDASLIKNVEEFAANFDDSKLDFLVLCQSIATIQVGFLIVLFFFLISNVLQLGIYTNKRRIRCEIVIASLFSSRFCSSASAKTQSGDRCTSFDGFICRCTFSIYQLEARPVSQR